MTVYDKVKEFILY